MKRVIILGHTMNKVIKEGEIKVSDVVVGIGFGYIVYGNTTNIIYAIISAIVSGLIARQIRKQIAKF